jgi:two-component system chemotaxis response regulator CheB
MSSLFNLYLLNEKSLSWKLQSGGVILLFKEGEPKACFVFEQSNEVQMQSELQKYWMTHGPSSQDKYKVIGFPGFGETAEKLLKSSRQVVAKVILRDVAFELFYDSKVRKIQVSKSLSQAPSEVQEKLSKIKVLVVDDSATIRQILEKVLSAEPLIEVIGSLANPLEVDAFVQKNRPDVMTLDIHMPEMDGVTLLKKMIPKYRIPTIMISSISKEEGPQVLEALDAGAIDYFQKPSLKDIDQVGKAIIESVKLAAQAKVRSWGTERKTKVQSRAINSEALIVIGSSTGGTEALRAIFESLPREIPPVLVVQHIPAVFSKALAERLDTLCEFEVKEAEDNDLVKKNRVLIAPGGKQMSVVRRGDELRIRITDDEPVNRHKPSVDYLFQSVADLDCPHLVGIILTGMGADGARGLKKIFDQGARTIAQDQATSVVWGMPREAAAMGGAEYVLPLGQVAERLMSLAQADQRRRPSTARKKVS